MTKGRPRISEQGSTNVRIPLELVARIEKLIPKLESTDSAAVHGKMGRSAAVRAVLIEGLKVLERK